MQLTENVKIQEVHAPISLASNTDSNTDRIDMQNWDGVVFIVPITDSVDTGVATVTVEQDVADADTNMSALSGAAATATSAANDDLNNTLLVVDVYRPKERYVQAAITSATANIAYGTAVAIQYRGRSFPVSQDSTVQDIKQVASPSEA